MKQSNIHDRKLNIIEQLILLNDDDVFMQVEKLINSFLKRPQDEKVSTKQELVNRAKISEENIEKGEVYTQEEVEKLSQSW